MKPGSPEAYSLPEWASAYFSEFRDRFAQEIPHRQDAFERLSGASHADMQRVWKHIDEAGLDEPTEIIDYLIYSTDTFIPDEKVPRYGPVPVVTAGRLTPRQTKARKLAKLLQELFNVTPQYCEASRGKSRLGTDIESLCVAFDFRLYTLDLDATRRKHDIEFIGSSKRGFIQHRRASDKIKEKAIEAARQIIDAADTPAWCADRLAGLVDELRIWPSFEQEHGNDPEYRSQKASWCDWVRVTRERIINDAPPEMLTDQDWVTLVQVLFDVVVDRQSVERVISKR